MKLNKSFLSATLVAGMVLGFTGCADDFAEINESKQAIVTAQPAQLLTQAIWEFNPNPYMLWFAQAPKWYYATQMSVPSGGFTQDSFSGGAQRQNIQSVSVQGLKYALQQELSTMDSEEAAKYNNIAAAIDVLCTYMGIYDTDDCGDIPYTEAAQARYGGTLTPKYDKVKDLYDLFLANLDACISAFQSNSGQMDPGNNDLIYKGDWSKWAKFANSIKLKIAVRLLAQDASRAKTIAQQVVSASCGYIDSASDNVFFHKADERTSGTDGRHLDDGDVAFNTGNTTVSYHGMAPTEQLVNFMKKNEDPRLRFMFTKNSWNSKVVNWFLENDKADIIPAFIMENVETATNAEGKTVFKAWKGQGEPWVRYYGIPTAYDASQLKDPNSTNWHNFVYADYFHYGNIQDEAKIPGSKTYRPYSLYNEEVLQGRVDFTVPTEPEGKVIRDTDDNPWWGMYLTAGEVNFYLAEFAVLGAISGNADSYFKKAVKASVEEWDQVAAKNKIPYYGTTYDYDENEAVIDLVAGETDHLLAQADYQLTGSKVEMLEKIYLQMLIHFAYQPRELFVTGRRTGVPMFTSSIFPRADYSANTFDAGSFARRSIINEPQITDTMYEILTESYKSQGISTTTDNKALNTERIWQDMGAPQWGAGPTVW